MPNVMEIWEPKPPGTLWATQGLLQDFHPYGHTMALGSTQTLKEICTRGTSGG